MVMVMVYLQAHAETVKKARQLLEMPPVLEERAPWGEVIEKDERLAGYVDNKMIFTDISTPKEHRVSSGVIS